MRFASPHPPISVDSCRHSYATFLLDRDATYPENDTAYIDGVTGEVVTRAVHRKRVLSFASSARNLQHLGMLELSRGSTAIVFSPNSVIFPVVMMGLAAAGICPAYANMSYKEMELAHAYQISGASHILVHVSLLPVAVGMLASIGVQEDEVKRRIVIISSDREIPPDILAAGWISIDRLVPRDDLTLPERFDGPDADSTAVIYFSSGTTGLNKAVALSHLNISVNILQMASPWKYYKRGQDIVLAVTPFFHIHGGNLVVLLDYYLGVPFVILPRFKAEQCLAAIGKYRITAAMVVPPILTFFATDPRVDQYDVSSLRLVSVGAAPVLPSMYDHCFERFSKRGIRLEFGNAYGLTEVSGLITWLPTERLHDLKGSAGALIANTEGRLVDENGNDVPSGTPGEIWLRGPSVMKGYVNNPQATADVMTPDGWLKTGDIALSTPDGYLTIVDRRKELIKYKGFQVAPAEMEAVLSDHPGIADSGVVGIYSEVEGTELPRAHVVPSMVLLKKDEDAYIEHIHKWLEDQVAHYKLMRGGIVLVDAIPRSPSGKILRRQLKELPPTGNRLKL
ncbi:hypothetical protein NM688_g7100 [Phlebia brevispora]|uniref:Uncharacterized protein n=1 Tax=Phlebia brevispora TaxID=194682 RepID=A0ACC1S9B6_9APHY|nr:hypothetical protein NM688_g7100 [Phlebia brevispora]